MDGNRGRLCIVACEAGEPFARKIHMKLEEKGESVDFVKSEETHFANGEIKTRIKESLRDADVYVIQDMENSTLPYSSNDNYQALKTAISSLRRSQPRRITPIMPAYYSARQDKPGSREGITASEVAREIEDLSNKIETVFTLEVHNTAIAGFFRRANLENLRARRQINDYLKSHYSLDDLMISSDDVGGAERAAYFADDLRCSLGFMYKKIGLLGLAYTNDLKVHVLSPTISLVKGLKEANEAGVIKEVIGTDAVYHGGEKFLDANPWYAEVSVASLHAKVIKNLNTYGSISALLD